MEQISFYLKKFETLEIKGDKLKEKIIKLISEILDVEIDKKNILILKTGEVKIKEVGSKKTIIFLNKKKIEDKLNKIIL
ncbi:hypothetical protein GW764_00795 [Candidatus Parcubacteria bacterium]|nr:hypothetical protein [Candidatus Parcubacteria bacterium]